MEPEPSIEIDRAVGLPGRRDRDRGAQLVVGLLEERHDHVQAVGRAALEDGHQDLLSPRSALSRRADQPGGREADARHRHSRRSQKEASRQHVYLLWNSGDPITRLARIDGVASRSARPVSIAASIGAGAGMPSRSAATPAAFFWANRLTSTLRPVTWPAMTAVAKLMRPSTLAVLVQVSAVIG